MSNMSAAHRFRLEIDRQGLSLGRAPGDERFVFHLSEGAIAIAPHPIVALMLAKTAAEAHGLYKGEHAQLLLLVAKREDLEAPVHEEKGVHWLPPPDPQVEPDHRTWVRFHVWLHDQFAHLCLLPAA